MAGPIIFDKVGITTAVAKAVEKKILASHPEISIKINSETIAACLGDFMEELLERPEDLIIEAATEKAIAFLKEVKITK